jgi:F-type H+-transporting ATPase subunit c
MDSTAFAYLASGIGAGIVTIGTGSGIAKLAATAMQSIARQPEAAGEIRGAMIITAAMIEGVALLSAAVCFMLSIK